MLAFTDWTAGQGLADADRRELQRTFAAQEIETANGYRHSLATAGFDDVNVEDLSPEWRDILRERLRMYRSLRQETVAHFGEARFDDYDRLYTVFVDLVQTGKLGGARVSAIRSAARRS